MSLNTEVPSSATKTFRLNTQTLFLTYPQCHLSPNAAITQLTELMEKKDKRVTFYLCAQEKHKDGHPHLHALLLLETKINLRDTHYLDLRSEDETFHGNYQPTRSLKKVMNYITKYGEYITNNEDMLKTTEKKTNLSVTVANAIIEGQTNQYLIENHPGFLLLHHQRINSFRAFIDSANFTSLPWPKLNYDLQPFERDVMWWLGMNLFSERSIRQDQLYLWGTPGCNKTSTIEIIMNSMKSFVPSSDVKWWDDFDNSYDMIFFDEFKGQWPVTFMNKILDGSRIRIPRRHGDYVKTRSTPVIICSNYPPQHTYQNIPSIALKAFISRLFVIEVPEGQFINIFKH